MFSLLQKNYSFVAYFNAKNFKNFIFKNSTEALFLGLFKDKKYFYTLGVPISRPLILLKYIFIPCVSTS